MKKLVALLVFDLALSTSAVVAQESTPNSVTLTQPVDTEYGTFGRGRQMVCVGREFSGKYSYVRVLYLEHEVLIPLTCTDLHRPNDGEPEEAPDAPRRVLVEAIKDRRIVIGMSAEQCRLAKGWPLRTNRDTTSSGESEQWIYAYVTVYLENGVVTSVSK